MVNAKNVSFKVSKQLPGKNAAPQPFATVINCRKPKGKRAKKKQDELKSQQVPLPKLGEGAPQAATKRKRSPEEDADEDTTTPRTKRTCSPSVLEDVPPSGSSASSVILNLDSSPNPTNITNSTNSSSPTDAPQGSMRDSQSPPPSSPKSCRPSPAKFRRGRAVNVSLPLDIWAEVFDVTPPDALFKMYGSVPLCFRVMSERPNIWKKCREHFSDTLPDPPADLNEFQYTDLRHGTGCMNCGRKSTRKTYWAFIRRWCKGCLQKRTIKEHEAVPLFKDDQGHDISELRKCIPSCIFDSWGNYVGVGPADAAALKIVYQRSDIQDIVAEYIRQSKQHAATWNIEKRKWMELKIKAVAQRREFARGMEIWEDTARCSKGYEYQAKKEARKEFFEKHAALLQPPIYGPDLEKSAAYRRAIAIPRDATMNSWLQLKPKLEQELSELRVGPARASSSSSRITNPSTPLRR